MDTHIYYEESGLLSTSGERKAELKKIQIEMANKILNPNR